ncbi:MAG: hypothetical protein WB711_21600 [Terriglobales bacterium]
MLSKVAHKFAWVFASVIVLGCTVWAQSAEVETAVVPATHTLTITVKGTIGPLLSGTDPLGLDGQKGVVKILASESLKPTKHTSTSATYRLPAGAITVTAGSNKFSTKSPSKMIINLTSKADTFTLVIAGQVDGVSLMVTDTTYLKAGSWTTAVLMHPGVFTPSPQKLTAAKTSTGPGCKIKYTVFGSTSILGFSGTASNSATTDPLLPDVSWDE